MVWGAFTLIVASFYGNPISSVMDFIWPLFSVKRGPTNHLWFLRAMLCIYLLFPLMKVAYDKSKKVFIYFVVLCSIFVFGVNSLNIFIYVCKYVFKGEVSSLWLNYLGEYNLFSNSHGVGFAYFCFGGLAFYLLPKIKTLNKTKVKIWSVVAIFISTLLWFCVCVFITKTRHARIDNVWDGYETVFTLINVIALFMFAVSCEYRHKKLNNVYRFISKNTLGIYIFHQLVRYPRIISRLYVGTTFMFGIVYTLALCAISLLITIIFQKIPIIKRLL